MSKGIAPRLTETQRALAVDRLSEDDAGHMVLLFARDFPEQFDVTLFALRERAAELKADA
jgi:hypothetical protein